MRTLGVEVVYEPDLDAEELVNVLDGVNVLIVRGTEVNKAAIDAGKALNLSARRGRQQHRRLDGQRARHLRRQLPRARTRAPSPS